MQHCLKPIQQEEERVEAVRLVIQIAETTEERNWVRAVCREEHYLHREVNDLSRWVAYMVIYETGYLRNDRFIIVTRTRVGMLIFGSMESSRCKGWYGSLADIANGWARLSQWELLTISRFWLDPRLQKNGEWFIECAASQVISCAIRHAHFEYLLHYPPAFLSQPWQIKELISYCQSEFDGIVYKACNFQQVRVNDAGLKTYMRPMPPLSPQQRHTIAEASRVNKAARKKRAAAQASAIVHEVLLIIKRKEQVA
jgi:hypothetical protein